jgi:GNAT superfamily N-acetyltransferase
MDMGEPCASCPSPGHVRRQIRRFPEGQFVAVMEREDGSEQVVGAATLMRTDDPPGARPKSWMRMVGGLSLRHHVPDGRWLYGVEMAVDPDWQGRGVGSALYRRRLALVRELGLAGMYAGGQLKGYRRYRRRMTPREYAERVLRGEIDDPTVTMQLRRGFRAAGVIEDYEEDEDSGNCAMLIVWRPPRRPRGAGEARQARPARGG